MKYLVIGVLCVGLWLCPVPNVAAQSPLTPQESRGKEIYLLGTSKSGKEILAYISDPSLEVPGSSMPCANCHGLTGQGKPEGGIDPSNITWETLSKPYGVIHKNGRKHPAYTARALELAVTRGLDPAGNKLLHAMPRYLMSKEDLADLVVYLKRLGTDSDPGITDDKITIGTALPAKGLLTEMGQAVKGVISSYFAEVNRQGGVYNRRLDLKVAETGDTPAVTRANFERLIKDEQVFAITGAFVAGAEKELVPLVAQWEVPLIGPMTIDPQISAPLNRQVFYLLAGNRTQAQALVNFVAKQTEVKSNGVAVVYYETALSASVLAGIKMQSERESLKEPQLYQYVTGSFDAAEQVRKLRQNNAAAVFFMGNAQDLLSLMKEAEKVNWFPEILLQSSGAAGNIFDAPAGFEGKLFLALPTAPADQTVDGLKEFRAFAEEYKLPQKHLAAQVTAYSSVKMLVEALKRAGKDLSREKLIQTLESFYQYSTGLTPPLTYGPNRRVGAMGAYVVKVELKEKKLVAASGWISID